MIDLWQGLTKAIELIDKCFIGNLTPSVPLSLKGEGEGLVLKGFHPFNLPHLSREGESVVEDPSPSLKSPPRLERHTKGEIKRGRASEYRELQRGVAPLKNTSPSPLIRGRGYRGWGYLIETRMGQVSK